MFYKSALLPLCFLVTSICGSAVLAPGSPLVSDTFAGDGTPSYLTRAISRQTVRIIKYDPRGKEIGRGGGVLLNDQGVVATSIDALAGGFFAEAATGLGDYYFIDKVIAVDGSSGLVLAQLEVLPGNVEPVGGYGKFPRLGEEVLVESGDCAGDPQLRQVEVQGLERIPTCPEFIHVRLPLSPCGTGSPVFDSQGRLAGILLVQLETEKRAAILVSSRRVEALAGRTGPIQSYGQWSEGLGERWKWSPTGAYLTGIANFMAVRYDQALPYLETALRQGKGLSEAAFFYLGRCYETQSRFLQALEAYLEALRFDPDSTRVVEHMAWIYLRIRELDAAFASGFRAVLGDWAVGDHGHLIMARIGSMCGEFEKATEAANEAVRIDPTDVRAHNELGLILCRRGQYDEAVAALIKATSLDPGYGEAFNNLGCAYLRSDRFFHAIVALSHAARIHPDQGLVLKNLGEAYSRAGLNLRSLDAYHAALRISPTDPHAFCRLADEYLRQGDPARAIAIYQDGIGRLPRSAWLHYKLGRIHCRRGDLDSALVQYETLLELNRNLADQLLLWIREGENG